MDSETSPPSALEAIQALLEVSPIEPYVRILSRLADEAPDAPALTFEQTTITRQQYERDANRLARAYADLGVGFGDYVTIALPNGIDFFTSFLACLKLGAVPQPVSYRLPAVERQAIVELADSRLVVGADAAEHPNRQCVDAGFRPDAALSDEPLPEVVSPAWKANTSGGSTGRPKLIVSGAGAEGSPLANGAVYLFSSTDSQIVAGPLYHNSPLSHAVSGLLLGQHVVILAKFDAEAMMQAIQDHKITWIQLVPTMMLRMQRVLESGAKFDLSTVRILWHMASKCPEWLKQWWIDRIGAEKVFELYGGTEMQAVTIINGTEWLEHRGSVGKPVIGDMRILDSDGAELPPHEIGEIYMKRPDGTAETYRYVGAEARVRDDGWESLGDLGWKDEDGYIYISDRRVDMIVSGGVNIYPAEVESALDSHPKVLSSVVVGLPDEDLGARVHALVEAAPGTTAEELIAFLGESLVRYKVPRSIEFIDSPIRDDAGKVRRSTMRDEAIARLSLDSVGP